MQTRLQSLHNDDPVPTHHNSTYVSTNPKHLTQATNVAKLITKINGEDTTVQSQTLPRRLHGLLLSSELLPVSFQERAARGSMYYPRHSRKKLDRKAITSLYYHIVSLSSLPWWQAYSIVNLYLTYGLNAGRAGVIKMALSNNLYSTHTCSSHQTGLDEANLEPLPLPGIKAGSSLSQQPFCNEMRFLEDYPKLQLVHNNQ